MREEEKERSGQSGVKYRREKGKKERKRESVGDNIGRTIT